MKVVFVIPVFNDWNSLKILSEQIKETAVKEKWNEAELVIVNDGSTQELEISPKPFALKSTVLNLISNQGNQRAITIGLSYINDHIEDYDYIIILDADGEDKPSDAVRLIEEAKKNEMKKIIFSIRAKRNEGPFYIFFYTIYKILFKLLTGQEINIGHFSCIPKKVLKRVLSVSGIWTHYCAALARSKLPFATVACNKGQRIIGVTNQSKNMLLFHGLASMAVYMEIIALRFLVFSIAGMFLVAICIILVFYFKLTGLILVSNWATSVIIGLAIIFIVFLLLCFFSLSQLLNKNLNPIFPSTNTYKHFILNEIKI